MNITKNALCKIPSCDPSLRGLLKKEHRFQGQPLLYRRMCILLREGVSGGEEKKAEEKRERRGSRKGNILSETYCLFPSFCSFGLVIFLDLYKSSQISSSRLNLL